jgi:hypothetical protein
LPRNPHVISIEAKGPNETLSYSQIKPVIAAVLKRIPGLPVIPLGIKLTKEGALDVLEFSFKSEEGRIDEITLKKYVQYTFEPPLPQWPKPSEEAGLPLEA